MRTSRWTRAAAAVAGGTALVAGLATRASTNGRHDPDWINE